MCDVDPSPLGALVDLFMDYSYMYYTCGVMMLVPGLFLFVMNFFNYRWLMQEEREKRKGELQIGSAAQLAADEEAAVARQDTKHSQEGRSV